jgi:DNA primase
VTPARVESVLELLGLRVASRHHQRAWLTCPWCAKPNEPPSKATKFFVRLRGAVKNRRGEMVDAAGFYHCFRCHRGGTLVDLVSRLRRVNFLQAARIVHGIEDAPPEKVAIRLVEPTQGVRRARYKLPPGIAFEPLEAWVSGARDFVVERYRLTAREVIDFRIGYAVDGRLAGRVVVPWLDARGRPAGYSARTFVDDPKRYDTPPEADGADQSVMVGEHLWPPMHERKRFTIAVTEGAFNAIAVRRAILPLLGGRDFPVAALGDSAPAALQVAKLSAFETVVVVTDPDAPGDKAAAALESMLGRHVRTIRARPPVGTDAAEMPEEETRSLVGGRLRAAGAL